VSVPDARVSAGVTTTAGTVLVGRPGSPGVGFGRALRVGEARPAGGEHSPPAVQARGAEDEAMRLRSALAEAARELTSLARSTSEVAGDEVGAIFEAQALFAVDPGIVDPALAAVAAGRRAADAILAVTEAQAQQLAAVDDAYFAERAADVRDVGRRVAALARGEPRPDLWHADGQLAVLVADDLDPSIVASLRKELVAGIVLAGGAPTSHAAIVARALGIPLVLGLGSQIAGIIAGIDLAVDGSGGQVTIDPSPATIDDLRRSRSTLDLPGASSTPVERPLGIAVVANVGSPHEAQAAAAAGADGIGLVRTELLFIGRHAPPNVAEQRSTYAAIRDAMRGRPVTFRTLDIGGDKPAAWQTGPTEANPALGIRGVRLGQRQPSLLDDQLRALVEAADGDELRIMIPMVATVEELDGIRERLEAVTAAVVADGGRRPASVDLGAMIEVPAAAVMAEALARSAAFFSIGTNDLVQYTMAADRTRHELADLASPLQPAVIRLIDGVVRAGEGHGCHVAVCGEAAADPAVVPILIGLGVTELSVTPSAIGGVRALLAGLDLEACRTLAARALQARTLAEVRALVV
jgi:phosphocarrier protein FPr